MVRTIKTMVRDVAVFSAGTAAFAATFHILFS
jgi:hypothetical protein